MSGKGVRKNRWSEREDDLLRKLIEHHGAKNWNLIARSIPGRNGKQCRERWSIFLDPAVSKGQWTRDEDAILINCQSKFGNKWAFFMNNLPGRSCVAIRNRWTHLRRTGQVPADEPEREEVPVILPKPTPQVGNWSVVDKIFDHEIDLLGDGGCFGESLYEELMGLYE